MLLVSILSIVNLAIAALFLLTSLVGSASAAVVVLMDVALTPVFAIDFGYRLLTAHSRRRYFFSLGWLDMIAIVPGLRALRVAHVAHVWRWLRRRGAHSVSEELYEGRAASTFLFTMFLVFLVVEVAGAAVFYVEGTDPNANIHSAGDAIWWGLVTITTVGYGDQYPVTPAGRVIGVFLLFAGIALFSVLTGFIANVFLSPRRRPLRRSLSEEPLAVIESVRDLVAQQDARSDEIRRRLDDLEKSLGAQLRASGSAERRNSSASGDSDIAPPP